MKKLLILIYILIFSAPIAFSQEVVVSEIFLANRTTGGMEWTELLVIQDNLSLVGYSIRDNGSTGIWMGGIKFNDIPEWKNLRSGTIIVIDHRGTGIDHNKDDGYLEVGALNSYFFSTFRPDGTPGPLEEGEGSSLDFNTTHDMIQIRNASDIHVHCLGFIGNGNYDVFNALPTTKAFHNQGVSQNTSVKILGTSLADYSAGLNPSIVAYNNFTTKGIPNRRSGTDENLNQLFWRELRQPNWSNPGAVTTRIVNDSKAVELKWTAASTFSDPNEGYMIVRITENVNINIVIEDGKIYEVGRRLGPYHKIIGYVQTLSKSEFLDDFNDGESFECGQQYAYRVYAYRFSESYVEWHRLDYDFNSPLFARGRQYNDNSYANSQTIIKEIPPTPTISSITGQLEFCSNVDAELKADQVDIQKFSYQWYFNGALAAGDGPTIKISQSGSYWLVIRDKASGCEAKSNELTVKILEAPEAFVRYISDGKTLLNDTTLYLCKGQKIDLQGLSMPSGGNITTRWMRNNNIAIENSNNYSITQDGVYRFIAEAGDLCPDSSYVITVKMIDPDFDVSESLLLFDADTDAEKEFIITNNSETELILNKADFFITPTANYQIISPATFPITVPPNGTITIRLRFSLVGFSDGLNGRISISTLCNYSKFVDLKGTRVDVGVTRLDPSVKELDLGLRASLCLDYDYGVDSVTFISSGTQNLTVTKPRFNSNNFSFVCDDFDAVNTIIVKPGGSFGGYVNVETNVPGTYNDELIVSYVADGKTDSTYTRVNVTVTIYDPSIEVITNLIDVSENVTCKKSLDTFIVVINPSPTDIVIEKDFEDSRVMINESLPKIIKAGKTDTIRVRLNFSNKTPFEVNFYYNNPCELMNWSSITIKPPTIDLDVTLKDEVIDIGIINNCEVTGLVTISSEIIASSEGAKIGRMIYNGTQISSTLFKDKEFNQGSNNFDIRIPASTIGDIKDSIIFVVEPCGVEYVIYIQGKRLTPSAPVFSSISVDFGTDNIFQADTRSLIVLNENADFSTTLDSLLIPAPFVLISHTAADFPMLIPASGSVEFIIEYGRQKVDNHNLIMEAHFSKPCIIKENLIIRGNTIDNRQVNITAFLPPSEVIELSSEKRLPINVQFDPTYPIPEIELRSMAFHLTFDYINLNLRTALTGQAINSPSSMINFDDSKPGKLVLTLHITEPDKVFNGDLILLTVKPLLGDALQAKIILDSVVVNSRMKATVETNESDISIIGDCDLEGRLLAVAGAFGITVRESDANSTLRIDYSNISDEKTSIKVYNSIGELVAIPIDGNPKPGDHSLIFNIETLPSGLYNFVLTNGIRFDTYSYPIVK